MLALAGCEVDGDHADDTAQIDEPAVEEADDDDSISHDDQAITDLPDGESTPVSEPTRVPTGSLEVIVYDEAGRGLPSARVCLIPMDGEDDKIDEADTNDDGIAFFEDLNPGTYRVILDQPRYLAPPIEVEVDANGQPGAELLALPGSRSAPSEC